MELARFHLVYPDQQDAVRLSLGDQPSVLAHSPVHLPICLCSSCLSSWVLDEGIDVPAQGDWGDRSTPGQVLSLLFLELSLQAASRFTVILWAVFVLWFVLVLSGLSKPSFV